MHNLCLVPDIRSHTRVTRMPAAGCPLRSLLTTTQARTGNTRTSEKRKQNEAAYNADKSLALPFVLIFSVLLCSL
jgi:hypothetical protein